jgi:glycerophosphoryl diester phosphodiesterase
VSFFDTRRPQVFAHRGGCALGPENTMAAFDRGLSAGADGLELDVHLSADGVVVVCHDDTLERTTRGAGPVSAMTAAELAKLDAGWSYVDGNGGHPFRECGVGIPTLRDVLERHPDVPVIIEMKVDTEAMGRAVAETVRSARAVDRVCGAGYGWRAMKAFRAALPQAASSACHPEVRLAVYRSMAGWPVHDVPYQAYQVPERAGLIRVVSPRFIRHARRAGLAVQVWTVDEEPDMRRLLDWGASALISNRPDLAVAVRNAVLRQTDSPAPAARRG